MGCAGRGQAEERRELVRRNGVVPGTLEVELVEAQPDADRRLASTIGHAEGPDAPCRRRIILDHARDDAARRRRPQEPPGFRGRRPEELLAEAVVEGARVAVIPRRLCTVKNAQLKPKTLASVRREVDFR